MRLQARQTALGRVRRVRGGGRTRRVCQPVECRRVLRDIRPGGLVLRHPDSPHRRRQHAAVRRHEPRRRARLLPARPRLLPHPRRRPARAADSRRTAAGVRPSRPCLRQPLSGAAAELQRHVRAAATRRARHVRPRR